MMGSKASLEKKVGHIFSPYIDYQETDFPWLGALPSHWIHGPLKYHCTFTGGGTPSKDNLEYWRGSIPWVSPKDMKSSRISGSIDRITPEAIAESSTSLVPSGAVLIVVRSGILQHTIPVAINDVSVALNQDMKALRFNSDTQARFFAYFVAGLQKQLLLQWGKQGATVESIEQEYLGNSPFPLPPEHELESILAFLDYETARIDTLIAKQQRLIELLKEKRQALISHAVTKGLNPDAPMKDSGVEWLGQVPAHWEVKRLKHISPKVGVGLVINPSHYVVDEGVHFLFGGNIVEYGIKLEKTRKMNDENSRLLPQSRLRENDLVCVRVGYPGVTSVIPGELEGSNCASMMVIRRGKFDSYWLAYCFNSDIGKKQVQLVQYGAAQKQYNIADAIEFRFPVPALAEQAEIRQFLDSQRQKFNQLIDKAERGIQLLQERRTALISAAVTGKIDVRNWPPPRQAAEPEPEPLMAAESRAEYEVS